MAKRRLKMGTSAEVRQSICRVANMLLNEEIEPRNANAIIYAANTVLSAIRTDSIEERLTKIEEQMNEIH